MNLEELVERVKGHTSGPWTVEEFPKDVDQPVVYVNCGAREVCRLYNGASEPNGKDAALIAAAPSLLTLALELKRENEELRAKLKAKGARIVGMENVKHIRGEE